MCIILCLSVKVTQTQPSMVHMSKQTESPALRLTHKAMMTIFSLWAEPSICDEQKWAESCINEH